MKKMKLIFSGLLVCLAAFALVSCATSSSSGGGGGSITVHAHFSWPQVWATDGTVDFPDMYNPVTGADISNAIVIASNESTGNWIVLTWASSTDVHADNGYYYASSELAQATGESVSLTLITTDEVIKGGPTTSPDTLALVVTPSMGATVALPVNVTWQVFNQTVNATHLWFSIYGVDSSNLGDYYQEVVPISQLSFTVTSSQLSSTGNYYISVLPVNVMNFSGAKTGSVGYVASVIQPYFPWPITITP